MGAAFSDPQTPEEREVKWQIDERNADQVTKLEQDIFKQKKRLADAERTLQTKTTKKATEDKRIAAEKIEWSLGKLADIRRAELNGEDSRIFPGWYACRASKIPCSFFFPWGESAAASFTQGRNEASCLGPALPLFRLPTD